MASDSSPSSAEPSGDERVALATAPPELPSSADLGGEDSWPGAAGEAAPEARALPHLGEKIDGYRLLESIGSGGMGAVFRAVDLGLDRQVALKILPPEQAVDPEVVRRYYQEGRAAAKLDHENIARVYAIGDDSRFHYIAFEYIEGMNVRQRVLRDGPLGIGDAVHLTAQIAEALVHSAGREVVHRDIKPSNIIVTPSGRAKLVDMGLARSFERRGEADLTQTGMTLGTFDYISPEQARDPRDVDIRGDLYSLGCTLFYMLSGRPPFPDGTVLQKLLQHREETPVDIRHLNPAVPDALARVVARLLAKERERRYQTPEGLIRDLRRVPARKLVPLPSARATPPWARHLVWSGPSVLFLLIFAFLLYWGDEPLPGPRRSRPTPPGAVPSAPPGSAAGVLPSVAGPAGLADRVAPSVLSGPGRNPARPELPASARELAVGPNDDLARILAEAPPRSTVVLIEQGPYELRAGRPVRLDQADLTIRGGDDVRPLIRLARDPAGAGPDAPGGPPGVSALFEIRGGRVTLDRLDFLLDTAGFEVAPAARQAVEVGPAAGPRDAASLAIEDAEVTIRRCSFRRVGSFGVGAGANGAGAVAPRPVAIRLAGTTRVGPPGRGSSDIPPASLAVEASDFEGNQVAILAQGPVDLSLHDVGFGPTSADQATIWAENRDPAGPVPAEFRLDHVSGLLGAGPMFRLLGTAPRVLARHSAFGPAHPPAPDGASPTTLVASDAPERLDWRGADNLFARIAAYRRGLGPRPSTPIRSFGAWADDPTNVRESGSSSFDGPLWEKLPATSLNLAFSPDSPRSFRMNLPRAVAHHPGARNGPFGLLAQPNYLGQPPVPNRTLVLPAPALPAGPTRTGRRHSPRDPAPGDEAPPSPPVSSPTDPALPGGYQPMPMPIPSPDPGFP